MADDQEYDEFAVDTADSDAGAVEGGLKINKVGDYHFEIARVECCSEAGKTPSINLMCVVLATKPGQSPVGSVVYHDLWVNEKEHNRNVLSKFAIAIGLANPEIRDGKTVAVDPANGTTRIGRAAWESAKGLQFVAHVQKEKSDDPRYEDKFKIDNRNVYSVHDPKVASVPKDTEAASLIPVPQHFLVSLAKETPAAGQGHQHPASKPVAALNVDDV